MIGLAVEQLSVTHTMAGTGKTLTAVQDVSFDAAPGEFVVLIGPSGCGKTTVLNGVAGLQLASSGRIRLDGAEVTGLGRERAMGCAGFRSRLAYSGNSTRATGSH